MDGLSSEVRLNRTEVNNGCLVKGRSSQSGSYKKKKERKKKKEEKIKNSLKSFWGEAARLHLSERAQHTLSPAITTHQTPGFFSPNKSSVVLCVCAETVCIGTRVSECVCVCMCLHSTWSRLVWGLVLMCMRETQVLIPDDSPDCVAAPWVLTS